MKIAYIEKRFSSASLQVIEDANRIIEEYVEQGFALTLRQLYYQFVSRELLPNTMRSYKRLGSIVNDARLAGHIDWKAIEDRTRNLRTLAHWESPAEIISACASQFRFDRWKRQAIYPEVWIEKDALLGVIEGICERLDVPFFSCRGYVSQSELWSASQRLLARKQRGQEPLIVHLGDHDPSGCDMTRDIRDRLNLFIGQTDVKRVALSMDQVEEYSLPPNPAKLSDSRADEYVARYGFSSWELDALEPQVIADLIEETILGIRDEALWNEVVQKEEGDRESLGWVAENWDDIV